MEQRIEKWLMECLTSERYEQLCRVEKNRCKNPRIGVFSRVLCHVLDDFPEQEEQQITTEIIKMLIATKKKLQLEDLKKEGKENKTNKSEEQEKKKKDKTKLNDLDEDIEDYCDCEQSQSLLQKRDCRYCSKAGNKEKEKLLYCKAGSWAKVDKVQIKKVKYSYYEDEIKGKVVEETDDEEEEEEDEQHARPDEKKSLYQDYSDGGKETKGNILEIDEETQLDYDELLRWKNKELLM